MFDGPDPFPSLVAQSTGVNLLQEPIFQSAALTKTILPNLPPVSQVAESSKAAHSRNDSSSILSPMRRLKIPRRGGWYVAHNAVSPGVYCGS